MKKKLREKDIPRIKEIVVSAFAEIDYHKDFDVYFTESAYVDNQLDLVVRAEGLFKKFSEYGTCRPTYGCFTEDEQYAIDLIESELSGII